MRRVHEAERDVREVGEATTRTVRDGDGREARDGRPPSRATTVPLLARHDRLPSRAKAAIIVSVHRTDRIVPRRSFTTTQTREHAVVTRRI